MAGPESSFTKSRGTIAQCLLRAAELTSDSARRDTEVLLCHVLQRGRAYLIGWPETELSPEQMQHFDMLMGARAAGEPVAYLTGRREFWSMDLAVTPATLIPRSETETLVTWALELQLAAAARVIDLGTGSGAIALALARERPHWQVNATDISEQALQVARLNARELALERIEFSRSVWFASLAGRFDLIVSNPPYVARGDDHLARGDLRFEPSGALVADRHGLADIEVLVSGAPGHLTAGGWILLEHGAEQGADVRELLQAAGFTHIETRRDMAGLERITGGRSNAG